MGERKSYSSSPPRVRFRVGVAYPRRRGRSLNPPPKVIDEIKDNKLTFGWTLSPPQVYDELQLAILQEIELRVEQSLREESRREKERINEVSCPACNSRDIIRALELINMNDAGDLCLDRISSLPSPIIDTILSLLPIKNAVQTSVLSSEWRYNWTRIHVLRFDKDDFIKVPTATGTDILSIMCQSFDLPCQAILMIKMFKFFSAIKECLKMHHGPLLDFSLFGNAEKDCVELDEIIRLVSRRGDTVEQFRLQLNEDSEYRLPLFFFALRKLTNPWLTCGCIYHLPTTFNGFRSLSELNLHHVKISKKTLLHLLSSCPLLEDLTLYLEVDDILGNDRSSITDLIKCLPAIRRLVTVGWFFRCFSVHSFLQKLPISLVGLKYLHIEDISFFNSGGLPSFFRLIQCFPNLEELSFLSYETDGNETITLKNYSNIWLKNLKEFEIYGFFDLKLRLEFVKLILAKSPMLKKVYIRVDEDVTDNQVSNISRLLQHSPRASRLAKITVERYI